MGRTRQGRLIEIRGDRALLHLDGLTCESLEKTHFETASNVVWTPLNFDMVTREAAKSEIVMKFTSCSDTCKTLETRNFGRSTDGNW